MLKQKKIAFIGAGNMAEALVAGMLKSAVVGPHQLFATDIRDERLSGLAHQFQIKVGSNNKEAAGWGDILILAVKPQNINEVLSELQHSFQSHQLIISIAAGIPIARIINLVPSQPRVIRAMPNTPAIVLAGVTALAGGPGTTPEDLHIAQLVFESVGKVVTVSESLMDTVTGLSGGGPAYVYVVIDALADGGVKMGLSRPVAQLLAAQTVLGAAKMVLETDLHPSVLKDQVASPGGTTIAGLYKLEEGNIRATLINAVESATARAKELGS